MVGVDLWPIRRFPVQNSVFTYYSQLNLAVGDLVIAPFRGGFLRAIVVGTNGPAPDNAKEVTTVLAKGFLSRAEIGLMADLGAELLTSPNTLLTMAGLDRLPIIDRAIPSNDFLAPSDGASMQLSFTPAEIQDIKQYLAINSPTVAVGDNFKIGWGVIYGLLKQPGHSLILVPTKEWLTRTAAVLLGVKGVKIDSPSLPVKMRAQLWADWRTGKIKHLVGTRSSIFRLPPKLTNIFLLQAEHDEYNESRRPPFYSAVTLATKLASAHSAKLWLQDPLPSFSTNTVWPVRLITEPEVVDLHQPLNSPAGDLLSLVAVEELTANLAAGGRSIIYLNRVGVGKFWRCNKCGWLPLCQCGELPLIRADDLKCTACGAEMWWPERCVVCPNKELKLVGMGLTSLKKELLKLFPQLKIEVWSKTEQPAEHWDILLTTSIFLERPPVSSRFPKCQLFINALWELDLNHASPRARLEAIRVARELQFSATDAKAKLLIQTWYSDFLLGINDPAGLVKTELSELAKFAKIAE